jgi:hypothetical protein
MVSHASTGKKCIGTARPGNSSGFLTSKGRLMEIGIITLAKDRMAKLRLKIMSAFLLNHFENKLKTIAAKMQASRFAPMMEPMFITLEKSASVANA